MLCYAYVLGDSMFFLRYWIWELIVRERTGEILTIGEVWITSPSGMRRESTLCSVFRNIETGSW